MKVMLMASALLVLSLGCVSQTDFDQAVRQNQELEGQVEALRTELQSADQRSQSLQDSYEQLRAEHQSLLTGHTEQLVALQKEIGLTRELEQERQELEESLETNRTESEQLREDLESKSSLYDSLLTEFQDKEMALGRANSALQDLQTETGRLEGVQEDISALEEELEVLTGERDERASELSGLETEKTELTNTVTELQGTVSELETQILTLEEQIAEYDGEIWTTPIACTGSMEPRIGCTDQIVIDTNVDPDEIEIEEVILFSSHSSECRVPPSKYILHRVVAKFQTFGEDGWTWNFLTRGDNALYDDRCWTPESHVYGRLAHVEEDVYPEKAEIRQAINFALSDLFASRYTYDQAIDSFFESYTEFVTSLTERCAYDSRTDTYYCYDVIKVRGLRDAALEAYDEIEVTRKELLEAHDVYKKLVRESRRI